MSNVAEHGSPEPGLHVRTDAAPDALAATLSGELDGQLCATAHEAETLLATLRALPALTPEAIPTLTERTARRAAAQRVVDRTLERAASEVGTRLAGAGSGVSIHPTAVRERAAAVVAARSALANAEQSVRALEEAAERLTPEPEPEAEPVERSGSTAGSALLTQAVLTQAPPARRRRRLFAFLRRRRAPEEEDTSESTSLLQQVAASTDEVFGARRASAAREEQLVILRAARIRADEDVRVAERAWQALAGDEAVEEVEAVVRRFDPQHEDALVIARDTMGVRAALTLLDQAREAWEDAWRSFGFDPPVAGDAEALDQMVARLTKTIILVGPAVDSAEVLAMAAPAAAVVAVEPAS